MEQSFQVTAIADAISELFEAFVVTLVSVDGGGRIVDPREARIAIRSSDDPQGVVAFDSYPQGIIINEGDQLMVRYGLRCRNPSSFLILAVPSLHSLLIP